MGIVAKSHLHEAVPVVLQIVEWLNDRGVNAILESETASLAGSPSTYQTATRDELPNQAELILKVFCLEQN